MNTSKIEVIMADGSQTPPAVSRAVESRIAGMNTPTLNHTPMPCPICREVHGLERKISYDGMGINSCGMYGDRIATLQPVYRESGVGMLLASAPDLLAENRRLREALELADGFIRGNHKGTANGDYCFKWRNEPLDPCGCELCQIRAALNEGVKP